MTVAQQQSHYSCTAVALEAQMSELEVGGISLLP
jgi:hypothetical protein